VCEREGALADAFGVSHKGYLRGVKMGARALLQPSGDDRRDRR
jgi:hypothetical protein